jgi:hypothetical protein
MFGVEHKLECLLDVHFRLTTLEPARTLRKYVKIMFSADVKKEAMRELR